MAPDPSDAALVQRYFDAMRAGADGIDDLLRLFHEEATYTEPFSGRPTSHRGKPAIAAMLRASHENAPPDLQLTVHRVEVDRKGVFADWSCTSPAFDGPIHGRDRYRLADGYILELETVIRPPG